MRRRTFVGAAGAALAARVVSRAGALGRIAGTGTLGGFARNGTLGGVAGNAELGAAAAVGAIGAIGSRAASAQIFNLDVPYVQTPQNVVDAMLELARVGRNDYLIDLGSGDGRIVITAATRFGTRGLGVEIDPRLVELSKRNAAAAGVSALADFRVQDLMQTDFSAASVVTMYLLPDVNLVLRPRLLSTLKPGSRVVSHDWDMGDWKVDRDVEVAAPEKKVGLAKTSRLMLWVIPADAGGRWSWRQVADRGGRHEVQVLMNLEQRYQQASGEIITGTAHFAVDDARLAGDRIEVRTELPFGARVRKWTYRGAIAGDRIEGEAEPDGGRKEETVKWLATRIARPPEPPRPKDTP